MELRNFAVRRRPHALVTLCALVLLGASSAVFWNMRATLDMPPAAAREVLREQRGTAAQRRNAIASVVVDVRQAIADLQAHSREGDEFATAALRQIRASADEALR